LKTIAVNVIRDLRRQQSVSGQELNPELEGVEKELECEFDREILHEAMVRVQSRIEWRTWEAFRLTGLEDCSGEEAAGRLEMSRAAVYMAKRRVAKMLQEEVARLNGEGLA
jgi:RNA polymerase sigma-70 factor (ECF subfamily)